MNSCPDADLMNVIVVKDSEDCEGIEPKVGEESYRKNKQPMRPKNNVCVVPMYHLSLDMNSSMCSNSEDVVQERMNSTKAFLDTMVMLLVNIRQLFTCCYLCC